MLNKNALLLGGKKQADTVLTVVMEMVPSDIAVYVYLIDGTRRGNFAQGTIEEFPLDKVSFVRVVYPSTTAIGTTVEVDNLLVEEGAGSKIYQYIVIDPTKDAYLRTYYRDIFEL